MAAPKELDILKRALWQKLAGAYRRQWHAALYAVAADGSVRFGRPSCRNCDLPECREARVFAIAEARRWGDPSITLCPRKRMLWAVPIMFNEEIHGGMVASITECDFFRDGAPLFDLRRACVNLRELAEAENLTNASALSVSRSRYQSEQQRAYALHAFKARESENIRELYLREEPSLFSAIRAGDRPQAREIINRILVAIHHHAGERLELVKSLFLELVVSMSRTAVESGGAPESLLGANYTGMTMLAQIDTEESLAQWLSGTLEQMMDVIHQNRRQDPGQALFDAFSYMEQHCSERISRDDAAAAAHLSPSHFSYLIRKETGVTFTEMLNRLRVDRAAEMLARSAKPLAIVALECGFEDQSYFTKVFKRYRNVTPGDYRRDGP